MSAPAVPSRWRRGALAVLRCVSGVVEDEASLRASSLAFSLLFCAAPMGAMLLGLSSMFPKAFSFLPSLLESVGPRVLPSALDEAAAALRTFSANAANLSLISLGFSLWSAFSLSMSIEKCAQACWGRPRLDNASVNPLARHWLALTLTPCAVALLGWAVYEALSFSEGLGSAWAPALLLLCFFLACSWALPAGKPPFRVACAASALASLECLLIQSGFGIFWARSQSYGAIYGAAAVFLGALLWVFLFWLSLLSSVSVCSTLFLGRARDLRQTGLGFLADRLGLPEWEDQELADQIAAPAIGEPGDDLLIDADAEKRLLAKLGGDPGECDPATFERLMHGRSGRRAAREALGAAVASRAARAAILASLPERLAKPEDGTIIPETAAGPDGAAAHPPAGSPDDSKT